MASIFGLLRKVENLNTDSIIEAAMEDTVSQFAEKQRRQLTDGFGSDGNRLKKYSNAIYAAKKARLNPIPGLGNPDHKLTGDYHRGIYMTVDGDKVRTGSFDNKQPYLEKRDPKSLGLGGEYKSEYLEFDLSPVIQRKITDVIGLSFGGS